MKLLVNIEESRSVKGVHLMQVTERINNGDIFGDYLSMNIRLSQHTFVLRARKASVARTRKVCQFLERGRRQETRSSQVKLPIKWKKEPFAIFLFGNPLSPNNIFSECLSYMGGTKVCSVDTPSFSTSRRKIEKGQRIMLAEHLFYCCFSFTRSALHK